MKAASSLPRGKPGGAAAYLVICAFLSTLVLASTVALAEPTSAARPFTVGIVLPSVAVADAVSPKPKHGTNSAGRAIVGGLRELGWIDGKNIRIQWRSAEGDFKRLPAIMEELVRIPVDVLVTFGPGVDPAMKATRTIPIVMSTSAGIANVGMVTSLGRPGANVTGVSFEAPAGLNGKRLELLKRIAPNITRVAILAEAIREGQPMSPGSPTEAAAKALGISVTLVSLDPDRVEVAFARALETKADAILVADGVRIYWREVQLAIHRLAERHRIPVMHATLNAAETGGLSAYGFDIMVNYRRMPFFIDRILRGAKASDLPIEQPTRLELVVNKSAARAIGLAIPSQVLVQADRVIE